MKHQVCTLLLLVGFSVCAESNIADKSRRIGRFSYEDSFDENLVETVLSNSSAVVKKNVKKLLYPDNEDDVMGQRMLLLGGTSNASTTAIAKAMALRCGYEYYVVEAAALLREYREGRQMLLSEIRPIIKQGKPIAIIITELPEMADYSGLLASTLWLLIDQCAQYPDVLVVATSAFNKGQLSEDIKERFGTDIISVSLDKFMQKKIEDVTMQKASWLERNKEACILAGGLACFALAAGNLYAQILFADKMLLLQEKGREVQDLQYAKQQEQYAKQEKQHAMQREQYRTELNNIMVQLNIYDSVRWLYYAFIDGIRGASGEVKKSRSEYDQSMDRVREHARKKLRELE